MLKFYKIQTKEFNKYNLLIVRVLQNTPLGFHYVTSIFNPYKTLTIFILKFTNVNFN